MNTVYVLNRLDFLVYMLELWYIYDSIGTTGKKYPFNVLIDKLGIGALVLY